MICKHCGAETIDSSPICLNCHKRLSEPTEKQKRAMMARQKYINETSPKNQVLAFFLCFWALGFFGVHRFYVGKKKSGILYLCTAGLCGIGYAVDLIMIILGKFTDADGKYLRASTPSKTKSNAKKGGIATAIVFAVTLIAGLIGGGSPETTEEEPPVAPVDRIVSIEATADVETAEETEPPVETAAPETEPETQIPEETLPPETEPEPVQEVITKPEPNPEPIPEPTPEPAPVVQQEIVWASRTGSKYHRDRTCSGMKSPIEMTKDEATQKGKSPCENCY